MKWFKCDQCGFKSKENGSLKRHKSNVHGIDVKWFNCDQCEYKCKENGTLKQHKAGVHGIDVKWFKCDQCEYKCKVNSRLKKHKDRHHSWHLPLQQPSPSAHAPQSSGPPRAPTPPPVSRRSSALNSSSLDGEVFHPSAKRTKISAKISAPEGFSGAGRPPPPTPSSYSVPSGSYDPSLDASLGCGGPAGESAAEEQNRLLGSAKERMAKEKMKRKKEEGGGGGGGRSGGGSGGKGSGFGGLFFTVPAYVGIPNTQGPPLPSNHHLSPSPYARLGLPPSSSPSLVKAHYKRLALSYHPDKWKGGEAGREECEAKFQAVKGAYEELR